MATSVGDTACKTTGAIVDGGKYAVNTTVETTGNVAHSVYDQTGKAMHTVGDKTSEFAHNVADGTKQAVSSVADTTKNVAGAGLEKTEQAWEGMNGIDVSIDLILYEKY